MLNELELEIYSKTVVFDKKLLFMRLFGYWVLSKLNKWMGKLSFLGHPKVVLE